MVNHFVSKKISEGRDSILYLKDLEREVQSFNRKSRETGLGLKITLTGLSETYAYYAQLLLPTKEVLPFLIYGDYSWGLYGTTDFSQEAMDFYYQGWYLWRG